MRDGAGVDELVGSPFHSVGRIFFSDDPFDL